MQTISDMINTVFKSYTEKFYTLRHILFFFGFWLPMAIQTLIMSVVGNFCCLALMMIT